MTASLAATHPTRSPWERWGWVIAAIWLVFLTYPVIETLETDASAPAKGVSLTLIAAFAVTYLLGWSVWRRHALRIWLAMLLLALGTVPVIGIEAIGLTPYLGAYAAMVVPAPWWKGTTLVSALLPILSLIGGDFPAFFFLMVWPLIGFFTALRVFSDLEERSEEARAELALVAERDRVARDVHDVLGHSLTALSIKAELAARLIEVDPARARAELESIQETARQALTEVRSTVGGLRAASLDAELEAAPRVLADAGVRTRLLGTVADTDPRHRTLLAWVLRESVTNVVRHAGASTVSIELTATGLVVADDGTGLGTDDRREGNGLRGMRERVAAAGGTLRLTGGSGTRVEVVLP
ncbi:sensor histidine kinase [Nocardioides donggukensis]|uniref:Sensor histidine kinase n=1 Tax=Nocardioides donggukensis TaxID=2774019 RepID=A0A927K5A8_9ACTN|nr:sensor histidine kinase [Nocardioides donggukensis]MBD8868136.1 sensor histidine kinase [Nocardioides donggukensis]